MSTIRLTVVRAKALQGGKHKVRVAVCHKQETAYIVTNIIIDSLSEWKNGQVVKRADASYLNTQLRGLLDKYQRKLDAIENQDLYSVSQLRNMIISPDGGVIYIEDIAQEYFNKLTKENRISYQSLLDYALRNFLSFIGKGFPMQSYTPQLIENFREWLNKNTKMSDVIIDATIARVRTLVNVAVKQGKVSYKVSPFASLQLHTQKIKECDISLDTLLKIRAYESMSYKKQFGRDMFMLSFYMGGMNFADLIKIDFRQEEICFNRQKTRNMGNYTTRFTIPLKAREIAQKYQNKNGLIDTGYHFKTYQGLVSYLGEAIQEMAKDMALTESVVFYSARKTFAQFAFDLGIPDSVVDYIIAHSPKNRGIISYYSKVKQKQADIALGRVIDYIDNPDKYKDYIEMRSDIMMVRNLK